MYFGATKSIRSSRVASGQQSPCDLAPNEILLSANTKIGQDRYFCSLLIDLGEPTNYNKHGHWP